MENRTRELALFNLGIDSNLRGRDLVRLKVWDICHGSYHIARALGNVMSLPARSQGFKEGMRHRPRLLGEV